LFHPERIGAVRIIFAGSQFNDIEHLTDMIGRSALDHCGKFQILLSAQVRVENRVLENGANFLSGFMGSRLAKPRKISGCGINYTINMPSVVVFPLPLGPSIPNTWPRFTSRSS